ncbi:MAG: hypothetical protein LBC33_02820 [Mycoplasmataceae bacterium]|jgi:hypothetical protein|nr:hypothetical protein [Mycoplasmataceae bacterium]
MKYQLHLNRRQKLTGLLYLICVLFAGLLIGFSLHFDRYAVIGNSTGTD